MKYFLLLGVSIFLMSCTLWSRDDHAASTISAEVPPEAKMIEGYDYPAIPLDEFNKQQ